MASSEPAPKRVKFDDGSLDQILKSDKLRANLAAGLDSFRAKSRSLILLSLTSTNAGRSASFRQAVCHYKESKPSDETVKAVCDVYSFLGVFQHGKQVLASFVTSNNLPEKGFERAALENLANVIVQKKDIAEMLQWDISTDGKPLIGKASWVFRLAHHLLIDLAVDKHYKIDGYLPDERQRNACPCCGESIYAKCGDIGDTSLGNPKYWHGSVDLLIGPVAVVYLSSSAGDICQAEYISSFETVSEEEDPYVKRFTFTDECQVIAETIVFSLLQKSMNEDAKYSLVPTIVFLKKHIFIYMYDGKHDILIRSPPYPIFDGESLDMGTLLALWLAVNYRLFSTGVTKEIFNRNFKANFFDTMPEEVKDIYLHHLKFGNCRTGISAQRYIPRESHAVKVIEGTPLD